MTMAKYWCNSHNTHIAFTFTLPLAKFWTTQTIHISVRRRPDASRAPSGVRQTWQRPVVNQPDIGRGRQPTGNYFQLGLKTIMASRRALLNVTETALSRDFSPTSTPTDAKKSHTPPGHRFNCDLVITLKPYRFHLFFKQWEFYEIVCVVSS